MAFPVRTVSLAGSDNICLIYDQIHYCRHNEGSEYIKHGVLLDEHSGKYDGNAQYERAGAYFFIPGQFLTVSNCQMSADGIVNMDTGPQISRSIHTVQTGDKVGKGIISWHNIRTKVVSVRPQGRDDQEDSHTGK